MTKEELAVKGPLAIVVAFLSYLAGIFSDLLVVLLSIMIFDYLTGLMRAILTHSLNSTIGLKGIMKKMAMLMIVGMSGCLEYGLMRLHMETHNAVVVVVISFFIVNEAISVLENSAQLGVPIPEHLYKTLEKLQFIGGKEQQVQSQEKQNGE